MAGLYETGRCGCRARPNPARRGYEHQGQATTTTDADGVTTSAKVGSMVYERDAGTGPTPILGAVGKLASADTVAKVVAAALLAAGVFVAGKKFMKRRRKARG